MAIEVQTHLSLEADPTAPKHAVNVAWVEQFFTGKVKMPVRVVATTNQAGTYTSATHHFAYTATGHVTIDGVTLDPDDSVLLVGQTDATQNGVYTVTETGNGGPGELTRRNDFDDSTKIFTGVQISVNEGTEHGATAWKLSTTGNIILDSTALEFIPVVPVQAASKYAEDIVGDDTETEFEIEHNLGTTDVSTTIRNLSTQGVVLCDVTVDDANTVTIGFAEPPSPAQHYRIIVMG